MAREQLIMRNGVVKRASAHLSDIAADRAASGWQPIETAPTNTSVLIFIPNPVAEHYGPAIYRAILVDSRPELRVPYWTTTALHAGRDCGASNWPTHWMPLPDPPETSK